MCLLFTELVTHLKDIGAQLDNLGTKFDNFGTKFDNFGTKLDKVLDAVTKGKFDMTNHILGTHINRFHFIFSDNLKTVSRTHTFSYTSTASEQLRTISGDLTPQQFCASKIHCPSGCVQVSSVQDRCGTCQCG